MDQRWHLSSSPYICIDPLQTLPSISENTVTSVYSKKQRVLSDWQINSGTFRDYCYRLYWRYSQKYFPTDDECRSYDPYRSTTLKLVFRASKFKEDSSFWD